MAIRIGQHDTTNFFQPSGGFMKTLHLCLILLALAWGTSAHANMVYNGDFEITDGTTSTAGTTGPLSGLTQGQWGVYPSIPGWLSNVGTGIEVQYGAVAPGNNHYVELDSHPPFSGSSSGTNSNMFQTITGLITGQQYVLQFDYWSRTGTDSSLIQVTLDKIFNTDTSGYNNMAWTTISKTFTWTGTGGQGILTFLALGDPDQLGGFIDNVSLTAAPVPVPAAVWMLGTALVGLVGVRRRMNA
jgi:hypothetical protein